MDDLRVAPRGLQDINRCGNKGLVRRGSSDLSLKIGGRICLAWLYTGSAAQEGGYISARGSGR